MDYTPLPMTKEPATSHHFCVLPRDLEIFAAKFKAA